MYINCRQLANLRGISVAAVRSYQNQYLNGQRNSDIQNNTLSMFESQNAHVIVGIDLQGVSEGVIITNNNVHLAEGVGRNPYDKYFSSRVRKFSSLDNVIKKNNKFIQDSVFEDIPARKKRSEEALPDGHPTVFVNEWENGGCPFGKA